MLTFLVQTSKADWKTKKFQILKAGTWVNLVNKNLEPIFYSQFRFWTANGWAICQWKKKKLGLNPGELFFVLIISFIGKWLSNLRFKIWILSKKGVHTFCLPDSLKSKPLVHQRFPKISYIKVSIFKDQYKIWKKSSI